uniref:Uncharacterized protein n=1 Tax=Seriola dumerili TaxID=41447 RepID=A0A3B4UNW6_SERDU
MGCGNSSPATNNSSVYVGLPTDLSNVPQVQIGSLRGNTHFLYIYICIYII